MNAVKRCLALIAATLVVGACGGDPTIDAAGTDLSIRATPGAVWMRNNTSATVNIEAVDKLGGPAAGSWAVGTIVGPLTAALDTAYQNTSVGSIGIKARFVVTPTAEGEGSVTFTGTGGPITVPVRIAPDTGAFAVTFSNTSPAIAEEVTATAPAGIRFTSATELSFYDGPLSGDLNNGLAAPTITGMSADSTQLTFLPAPGAAGQVRFTGLASIGTPGLTTSARSVETVTVPGLASVGATFSSAAPTVNTPITVTMPVNFKFRPTSTFTGGAGNITGVVLSVAADSLSASVLPPPGADPLTIQDMVFSPIPDLSVALPTSGSVTVGAAPDLGEDDPFAGGGEPALYHLAAPTVVGTSTGFYDQMTLGAPDFVGDGGIALSQLYVVTFANAGDYTFTLSWDNESDVDLFVVDAGFNSVLAQSFNAAGEDESGDVAGVGAGDQVFVLVNMFSGSVPPTVRLAVTRTN